MGLFLLYLTGRKCFSTFLLCARTTCRNAFINHLFLFFGYCFDEEDSNNALSKAFIILGNIVVIGFVMFGTTVFINPYIKYPIHYVWMHVVNVLFAVIVAKANYDGNALKKKRRK